MSIEEQKLSKESKRKAKKISNVIDMLESLKTGNLSDLDILAINHTLKLLNGTETDIYSGILMGY